MLVPGGYFMLLYFRSAIGEYFIIKILKRYFFERIKMKTCLITNMIKGCILFKARVRVLCQI